MRGGAEPVREEAPAKLNVFLRVLGRREDGYHDLESLILPLALHDVVTALPADGLALRVEGPRAAEAPGGDENLCLVAARTLAEAAGIASPGADLVLDKRVPVAAGMGGGSSDAAATLRALDRLWRCDLEAEVLGEVGARVGSDVPALLVGEPVFVSGRGERVAPVHVLATTWVVKPFGFPVRTPDAFGWWDEEPATGPDAGVLIAAAETGNVELLGSALFNDLQAPVVSRHPEVGAAIDAFLEAGALGAVMTGSGPTVAALAAHPGQADRLARAVHGSFVTGGPPAPSRPGPVAG